MTENQPIDEIYHTLITIKRLFPKAFKKDLQKEFL